MIVTQLVPFGVWFRLHSVQFKKWNINILSTNKKQIWEQCEPCERNVCINSQVIFETQGKIGLFTNRWMSVDQLLLSALQIWCLNRISSVRQDHTALCHGKHCKIKNSNCVLTQSNILFVDCYFYVFRPNLFKCNFMLVEVSEGFLLVLHYVNFCLFLATSSSHY